MNPVLILGIIGAVAGPLLAYFAAARKLSGSIETSEAASLWEEATALRNEYKAEAKQFMAQLEDCRKRISDLELHNAKLHQTNGELMKIIAEHEKTILLLREENRMLSIKVSELERNGH